ncbi:MAG TPA: GNAT family N-acetyltransferase [Stellaceae bacterium]|nr:GNAT family N-acetyltransferase [Stellaceae bacterium]
MSLRILARGDEAALDSFLAAHADSSMFLRSNLRSAGIVYRGAPLEAVYVACFRHGRLAGVAAHCWNGIVLIQAGAEIDALMAALVDASERPVTGIVGPLAQVRAARSALGMSEVACQIDSTEELYALALDELAVPPALRDGKVRCRRPERAETPLLAEWRYAYSVEALNSQPGVALRRRCEKEVELLPLDWQFMLVDGDEAVAYSAFNAALPEAVQIGGVWTPPERRGRGYGRSIVAGSLLAARDGGARRAVLFTGEHNVAAKRAYAALGFRRVGDWAIVLFADPA